MLVLVAVAATTSNFRFANDMGVVVFFFWQRLPAKDKLQKLQAARPLGTAKPAKPKPNQKINTLTRFGQTIR